MIYPFIGALALVLLYSGLLRWGWRTRPTPPREPEPHPPVSVVVALRDEEEDVSGLLDALDAQTHPSYEVVLVDDASTDTTLSRLRTWADDRTYARIVPITSPAPPRKKTALTRGVDAASHDLLAFTDADCRPPPTWLSTHAAAHAATDNDTVLVGHSPIQGDGLLGTFAQYEGAVAATYAAAAIGLDRPYMAVGRNLSYPRSVFAAAGGFSSVSDGMSGDDDLFVQALHRQDVGTIRTLYAPEAAVPTSAPASWAAWWHQRRRHVSAGRYYSREPAFHLTLLHTSLIALWTAPLLLGPTTGVGLLATGLLARHALLAPACEDLGRGAALPAGLPLWEAGYALVHLVVAPIGLLSPPESW
jgi:cellulose synthase/poly-beta-1,6-N-acetylglucosamine synthase-like glycosyltransferase